MRKMIAAAVVLGAAMGAGCSQGPGTATVAQPSEEARVFPNPTTPPPKPEDFPTFAAFMQAAVAAKPGVMARQNALLASRYDLSDRTSQSCRMFRGTPVQKGVRAKLPRNVTLAQLQSLTAAQIRARDLFPAGFLPLPHPNHPEGGMVFPKQTIDEIKRQTGRDLERFDVDFDLPQHFMPEFPPPIFLTTRPDLGDVSRGQLVTTQNFWAIFKDIVPLKQLDGLRLLVTPFPQQQFNMTDDRRSREASLGVSCFDCHVNGHTNGATHLVGDIRPQAHRNRLDSPSLRGLNIQRLFGSQRALKTVEDFTEFEQRGAYFDADIDKAVKKGVNILDRGGEVHQMAEVQEMLAFPPAPKLNLEGRLDPAKATPNELRGEMLFHGKARCAGCHAPPYYTDNLMHDLQTERFFEPRMINGHMANGDGPIKTFPLRGIKDSPPYFHDGRLLTLDDVVAFFDLILETKLTEAEKDDLVMFLCAL